MAHPSVELAELLVAFLNDAARPWSGDWTAKYRAAPSVRRNKDGDPDIISDRLVIVSPQLFTSEIGTRAGTTTDDVAVSIGFMQTLPGGKAYDTDAGDAWLNTQLADIAEVITECQTEALALGDFRAGQFTHDVISDPANLSNFNLFVSIVRASFVRLT